MVFADRKGEQISASACCNAIFLTQGAVLDRGNLWLLRNSVTNSSLNELLSMAGFILHCCICVHIYSLLCLREGEAEGEATEVRGAGTGHLRTGSSKTLLRSISSILYSRQGEKCWKSEMRHNEKQRREKLDKHQ